MRCNYKRQASIKGENPWPKPHFRLILTMCVWTSETNEHACQLLLHSSLCLTFLLSAFQAESNLCAIGFGGLQFRVKQVWQLVWGLRFPASSIAETDFIFKIWWWWRKSFFSADAERVEATLADLKNPIVWRTIYDNGLNTATAYTHVYCWPALFMPDWRYCQTSGMIPKLATHIRS